MLLDHRTYTVRPGTLRKQMALYEKHGLASQKRHFGEPLAWLVSETGDVNTYVHIWVYEDAEDRNRKRTALFKDPEWLKYLEMNAEAGIARIELVSFEAGLDLEICRTHGEGVRRNGRSLGHDGSRVLGRRVLRRGSRLRE